MSTLLRNQQLYPHASGAMKIVNNSTATVISTQSIWHPIQGLFTAHHTDNFTFNAGEIRTISSVADAGGGDIRVQTSAPHTMIAGDPVTLTGTTNYNGYYLITNVSDTTHFDVTIAYVATDTGSAIQPDWFITSVAGEYTINYAVSVMAQVNNDILEFTCMINTTPNDGSILPRKYSSVDTGVTSGTDIIDLTDTDRVFMVARNQSGTGDITITYANINFMEARG